MTHRDSDAPCRPLPWDTDFFGFTVARVEAARLTPESAAQIDAWCDAHAVRCLYFLADPDDPMTVQAAEGAGYHFVDVRLTLEISDLRTYSTSTSSAPVSAAIRPFADSDVEALAAIARVSYTDSRYYFDLHFDRQKCDALYETWVRVDCAEAVRDPAHHTVFVAELDGQPAGFVTCHIQVSADDQHEGNVTRVRSGVIGLVGMVESARGQGFAQIMINEALNWFAGQGCKVVTVVTQARNVGAQRVYQRCGFVTRRVQWSYHKWF